MGLQLTLGWFAIAPQCDSSPKRSGGRGTHGSRKVEDYQDLLGVVSTDGHTLQGSARYAARTVLITSIPALPDARHPPLQPLALTALVLELLDARHLVRGRASGQAQAQAQGFGSRG